MQTIFQNESIHLFNGNVETECANCIIKKLYNNNELDQLVIYWNTKIFSTLCPIMKIKQPGVNVFE